uniref:Uncharacterized protein n=1 Tax=Salix viminalis TaxID=40686 RepID=A0A6N2MYX8_SALVM
MRNFHARMKEMIFFSKRFSTPLCYSILIQRTSLENTPAATSVLTLSRREKSASALGVIKSFVASITLKSIPEGPHRQFRLTIERQYGSTFGKFKCGR